MGSRASGVKQKPAPICIRQAVSDNQAPAFRLFQTLMKTQNSIGTPSTTPCPQAHNTLAKISTQLYAHSRPCSWTPLCRHPTDTLRACHTFITTNYCSKTRINWTGEYTHVLCIKLRLREKREGEKKRAPRISGKTVKIVNEDKEEAEQGGGSSAGKTGEGRRTFVDYYKEIVQRGG
ncbi:hypothetical protein PMIN06_008524 [Paraphaeosphaeria minitans]